MARRPGSKIVAIDAYRAAMQGVEDLRQAQQQIQDVGALLQTAIGALRDIRLVLQRMLALATLAADRQHTAAMRDTLRDQLEQLAGEVDHLSHSAEFNARKLLDGSFTASVTLQVGDDVNPILAISLPDMRSASLGLGGFAVDTAGQARQAVTAIETAIHGVSTQQAELGGAIHHLHEIVTRLRSDAESASAAMPRITDRDMASQVTSLSRSQILRQPATALWAQARSLLGTLLRFPGRPPKR